MYQTNVIGLARVTRALLPALERSGDGHIVNVGSIAGIETYEGGAGYTAAKHAVAAVTETLRLELLGKPIRVTEVQPGLVETEFSLVRFDGDTARAAKVYEGMTPLKDCPNLKWLQLNHCNLTDKGLAPLLGLKNLETLILIGNKIALGQIDAGIACGVVRDLGVIDGQGAGAVVVRALKRDTAAVGGRGVAGNDVVGQNHARAALGAPRSCVQLS